MAANSNQPRLLNSCSFALRPDLTGIGPRADVSLVKLPDVPGACTGEVQGPVPDRPG
jgi:hypothetical protein